MSPFPNPLGVEHGARYVITSPSGVRAVLNDSSDPDFVGFVAPSAGGVTGLERAGVRESSTLLPEADGGVHGTFYRDRLAFTINGIVPPDGPGDSWVGRQARLLAATDALDADGVLSWQPSEAPAVEVAFRAQQPTRITGFRPKTFLFAGVCERPGVYSNELHVAALSPSAVDAGGFASPLTSPLTSDAVNIGALNVTNLGTIPAWPVFTITGPCVNPSILNVTTGEGLYLTTELVAGETLTLDSDPRRRTIKADGQVNRYGALHWGRSTWPSLVPGTNDLRIGFDIQSAPAGITVAWRDAWG